MTENKRRSLSNASEQEIPATTPRSDVTFSPENETAFTSEITTECTKIIQGFSSVTKVITTESLVDKSNAAAAAAAAAASKVIELDADQGEDAGDGVVANAADKQERSEKSSPAPESDSDIDPSFTVVSKEETSSVTEVATFTVVTKEETLPQQDTEVDVDSFDVVSLSDVTFAAGSETLEPEKSKVSSELVGSEDSSMESVIDKCSNQFKLLDLTEDEPVIHTTSASTATSGAAAASTSGSAVAAVASSPSRTKTTTTVVTKIEKLDAEGNIIESSTIVRTTDSETGNDLDPKQEKSAEEKVADWGKPLGLPSPANPAASMAPSNRTPSNTRNSSDKKSRERIGRGDRKISPVYLDLAYVPHHGDANYSDVEFFKKVRARYYVLSGVEPSKEVLNALLEAKMTWENKDLGNYDLTYNCLT